MHVPQLACISGLDEAGRNKDSARTSNHAFAKGVGPTVARSFPRSVRLREGLESERREGMDTAQVVVRKEIYVDLEEGCRGRSFLVRLFENLIADLLDECNLLNVR